MRSQGPHLTQCVVGPQICTCQMAYKSVEQFKQLARMWLFQVPSQLRQAVHLRQLVPEASQQVPSAQ